MAEQCRLDVRLAKEFNGFDLDVTWCAGDEIAVLFGYSGSGKSVTMRMIAGLMKPDSGRITLGDEVLFDGEAKTWVSPQERNLGFVSQDLSLFPHLSVLKNITYGLKHLSKAERLERAAEFMSRFHLEGLAKRLPGEISGGQAQRVALARALVGRPKALLLDEPFSALDLPLKEELWELIRELRESLHIPILVVTHDAIDARTLAERIIVYREGRVVASGVPAKILDKPSSPELITLAQAGVTFDEVSEWATGFDLELSRAATPPARDDAKV